MNDAIQAATRRVGPFFLILIMNAAASVVVSMLTSAAFDTDHILVTLLILIPVIVIAFAVLMFQIGLTRCCVVENDSIGTGFAKTWNMLKSKISVIWKPWLIWELLLPMAVCIGAGLLMLVVCAGLAFGLVQSLSYVSDFEDLIYLLLFSGGGSIVGILIAAVIIIGIGSIAATIFYYRGYGKIAETAFDLEKKKGWTPALWLALIPAAAGLVFIIITAIIASSALDQLLTLAVYGSRYVNTAALTGSGIVVLLMGLVYYVLSLIIQQLAVVAGCLPAGQYTAPASEPFYPQKEPVQPIQPVQPVQPEEFAQPVSPVEPAQSAAPAQPESGTPAGMPTPPSDAS